MKFSYSYIEEKTEHILIEKCFFEAGFDVNKFARKCNVDIIAKDFDDDVSGLFVIFDGNPIISYNKKEGKERQRFTVAHELGHYFLHSDEKPLFVDKKPKILFRNSASSSGEIHQEREANAFAASLLMPRKLIEKELESLPEETIDIIKSLSKIFKVSEQAMSFRLSNLGYDMI